MRIWRVAPFLACLFLSAIPAKASDRLPVVGPTDFHFTFSEAAQFTARAYAIEHGVDSMLWLYDGAGNVVAANDDWFGLDSWLDVPLEAGVYRLRAGVCCGDPEAWYGESYEVELNSVPVEPTTTTVQETTTTSEPVVTDPPPTDPPVTEPETTTTSEPAPTTTEPAPPPVIPPQPEEPIWIPPTPDTVPAPDLTEPAATEPSVSEPDSTEVPADTDVVTEDSASVPSVSETAPSAEPETEPETEPEPEEELEPTPTPEPDTPTEPDAVEPDATLPPLVPETPSDATTSATVPAPPSDAPEAEKRAFEEEVNIFAGGYDNYVPAGSTVTVAQRRTIVAATIAVSSVLPGPAPSRRRK